jgi:hypothetical protein
VPSTTPVLAGEVDSAAAYYVQLQVWKPFRWLIANPYGELSLSSDHVTFNIQPLWRYGFVRVLAMILYWGFDILSWFRTSGHSQVRNVSTASLIGVDWIVWRANILVIWSAGYLGFYSVTNDQLSEVQAFVDALKKVSAEAKSKAKTK